MKIELSLQEIALLETCLSKYLEAEGTSKIATITINKFVEARRVIEDKQYSLYKTTECCGNSSSFNKQDKAFDKFVNYVSESYGCDRIFTNDLVR